jgi:hypothetical protein
MRSSRTVSMCSYGAFGKPHMVCGHNASELPLGTRGGLSNGEPVVEVRGLLRVGTPALRGRRKLKMCTVVKSKKCAQIAHFYRWGLCSLLTLSTEWLVVNGMAK